MDDQPEVVVLCSLEESACRCGEEAGHDGPHVCGLPRCRGAWTYDEQGKFQALRLPGNGDAMFASIFGDLVGWDDQ